MSPGVDAKRLHQLLSICALGWTLFAVNYSLMGRWRGVAIDIAIIVCTLGVRAWMIRQAAARAHLAAHLAVLINVLGLVAAALNSGQGGSTAMWFLVPAPLVAAHMLGIRAASVWAGLAIAAAGLIYASDFFIRVEPEFIEQRRELVFNCVSLVLIVLAFAIAARRAHDKQVATIERQAAVLAKQTVELAAARDAALETARLKNDFVATVSHEIRTPLSGVLASISLLEDSALDAQQTQLVSAIKQSGAQLLHVVNDILDFSRIEANKLTLAKQSVSLQLALSQVVTLLLPLARDKTLSLTSEIAQGTPAAIVTDPTRLSQILINLVGNALKFTASGGVHIQVTQENGQIIFAVADTGIGITQESAAHLFQPFSQVDNKKAGTGLGLVITRRLVELLGGRVWFDSEPFQGTTFFVALPLVIAPSQQKPSRSDAAPSRFDPALGSSHPLSILLVEDHAINRTLALRMLQRFGYQASVVNDGEAAVGEAAQRHYDLILMDMRLPGIDGATATRQIRDNCQGGPQPRIIAMTANVMEDRQRWLEMGFDGFVGKPIDPEELRAALTTTEVGATSSANQ